MGYGLRTFNTDGSIALDTTDRILRLISQHNYDFGSSADELLISVPGMVSDGTWFAITLSAKHWCERVTDGVRVKRQSPSPEWGQSGKVLVYRG